MNIETNCNQSGYQEIASDFCSLGPVWEINLVACYHWKARSWVGPWICIFKYSPEEIL